MTNSEIGRREFARWALRALGSAALVQKASAVVHKSAPGIKLCAQSSPKPSDEQLLFLQQIGAQYVSIGSTPDLRTAEGFMQINKRYSYSGITVWTTGHTRGH